MSMKRATDASVTPDDLLKAMLQIRNEGMGPIATALLQREPALGDLIAQRWDKIQTILLGMGLSDEQIRPVLIEAARLIMEPLIAIERSHRRMWEDFLPDVGTGKEP